MSTSPTLPSEACRGPRLWAIGGGKGGVGKSVVTLSLGVALAARGLRCALVDADLGGANLHTLLGERSPSRTLSHFLSGRVERLADVLQPTALSGLWLASGARALLDAANPRYFQKQKLLRHLRRLEVDFVLIDLAAGSNFNVLDFFAGADRGVLVTAPEPTAIENTYHFIKAAFYRSLRGSARDSAVAPVVRRVLDERSRRGVHTARELIDAVCDADAGAGAALRAQARRFTPGLVVNQARTLAHRELGDEIARACGEHLGIRLATLGALERDECVRDAVRRCQPVATLFPGCPFSRDLDALADRLLANGHGTSEDEERCETAARAGGDASLATWGLEGCGNRSLPRFADLLVSRPLAKLDVSQPGDSLRRRREQLRLELSELIARTRIHALADIEAERFERLPAEPYLRGFLLQYARELGIREAESLAESYLARYRRCELRT